MLFSSEKLKILNNLSKKMANLHSNLIYKVVVTEICAPIKTIDIHIQILKL